ncbi:MAG: hypothetical protein U0167_04465 [bacterium]
MRARALAALFVAVFLIATAGRAAAQVLRDLPALDLRYDLFYGDPAKKVGSASVSFKAIDTPRGRRLEVKSKIEYTLQREQPKAQAPFAYAEEATLLCDQTGVVRFDTSARALGDERVNSAIRIGENYQLTTTFQGKKHTKTITAGVQRTNFGLFAGGYLEKPLDGGDMFEDFPLLYPVGGDHKPRQKFREGIFPFTVGTKQVPAIVTRLDRPNKTTDRIWNAATGPQILIRMEEASNMGKITYELVSVNGVAPDRSALLQ